MDFSPTALAEGPRSRRQRGVSLATEIADVITWRWPQAGFDVLVAIFVAGDDGR